MTTNWRCSITLPDGSEVGDLLLSPRHGRHLLPGDNATLQFLSVVETSHIPLCLILGAPHRVCTSNPRTAHWFSEALLNSTLRRDQPGDETHWRESVTYPPHAPLGVLVAVDSTAQSQASHGLTPRVTELLFYASQCQGVSSDRPLTPPPSSPGRTDGQPQPGSRDSAGWEIHALALSADLLVDIKPEPTPPASPTTFNADRSPKFLPTSFSLEPELINHPPVHKRKSATSVFDEATERHTKARRSGGSGVHAAVAPRTESQLLPQMKPSRPSTSHSQTPFAPPHPKLLSRSPSVASSRPPTASACPANGGNRSAPSQVQSAPPPLKPPDEPTPLEAKNKTLISRTVMAGLRLHGFSSHGVKSRISTETSSRTAAGAEAETQRPHEVGADADADAEAFKALYHHVYKAVCFAFRAHIRRQPMQPCTDVVRETVDALLKILARDPLADGLGEGDVEEGFG